MIDGSIIVYQSTGADLIRNEDFGLTGDVGGLLEHFYVFVNYIFAVVRVFVIM